MIHRTLFTFLYLLPLLLHSVETDQTGDKKLLDVTHSYIEFINRISKGEIFPVSEIAASLLAPDCKKIFNGKTYTENRDDFISDLLWVNKTQGCWSVYPADVIISSSEKTAVLRLLIDMDNVGAFTAIVILRYDPNYLISEINEVFNKVEGVYNFEGEEIKQKK